MVRHLFIMMLPRKGKHIMGSKALRTQIDPPSVFLPASERFFRFLSTFFLLFFQCALTLGVLRRAWENNGGNKRPLDTKREQQ